MAGNQLPPPAPFLPNRGDPPGVPWHRWFKSFQTYLVVCGLDDKSVSDARRRAILLHCLGTEVQRVFSSLDESSGSYEESIAAHERQFGPKHSVLLSRYKFRQRSQQAGQSVMQFVAALRELATFCSFGGLCEEVIRDQLIEKTSVKRIRERLLMEPDSLIGLIVDRAIQLALQVETAILEARTLQPSLVSGSSQVQRARLAETFPGSR